MEEQSNPNNAAEQTQRSEENDQKEKFSGEARKQFDKARSDFDKAMGSIRKQVGGFDAKQTRSQVEEWVRENPTLTVFLSIGAGLLLGKAVRKAVTPAPPPPFRDRVRQRATSLASEAQRLASDTSRNASKTGRDLGLRAGEARQRLTEQAREFGEEATRRASDFGREASRQAEAVRDEVSRRASDAGRRITEQAGRSGLAQGKTDRAASTIKKKARHGSNILEVLMLSVRSALVAAVLGGIGRWLRKFR